MIILDIFQVFLLQNINESISTLRMNLEMKMVSYNHNVKKNWQNKIKSEAGLIFAIVSDIENYREQLKFRKWHFY